MISPMIDSTGSRRHSGRDARHCLSADVRRADAQNGVVLAVEVVEEGAPRNIGPCADRVDRHLVQAVAQGQADCRLLEPAMGLSPFAFTHTRTGVMESILALCASLRKCKLRVKPMASILVRDGAGAEGVASPRLQPLARCNGRA